MIIDILITFLIGIFLGYIFGFKSGVKNGIKKAYYGAELKILSESIKKGYCLICRRIL